MPDSLDDIPDMPDSFADVVPLEEAIDGPVPIPAAEAAPLEQETIHPEPPQIVVAPLPVVDAATEGVVQAETTVPEPVPVEPELPELPVAAELPELSIAPPEPQMAEPVFARATPAKIVWDGLEDDIPSDEDVQAVLLEEQLQEARSPQPVAEPIIPEPVQIEAKPAEIAVVQPEPQMIQTVPASLAPAKVACEGLDDDIPSEAEAQAALMEEESAQPAAVSQLEHEAPRAFMFGETLRPLVVPDILAVADPDQSEERREPVYQAADDQIFAAYSGKSWPAVNVNYRSVLVGVGVLTMAILFFVGRVIMSESFASQGPLDTVEAETVKGQQMPPARPQQNVVTPGSETGLKSYVSTPPADEELDAGQLRPLPSDEGIRSQRQMFFPTPAAKPVERDVSASTSEVTPRVQPPPPPPAAVAKNNAKPLPFSPSVVIPYKGPQKAKTNSEKDCADQQTAPVQNKASQTRAANITRPRVVRDPQN
jgi:hypothetical protein